METQAYSETTYRQIFGIKKTADLRFAEELVGALSQIDRGLLPPAANHPLSGLIAAGSESVAELIGIVEKGDEQEQLDAIDALAHIFLYQPCSPEEGRRLRACLNHAGVAEKNPEKAALIAKCLAIGKDEELLVHQLRLLDDDDPGIVATAARLLGLGRFEPAVPLLNALLSPDRYYESRYVIWALGEIGHVDGLNQLEYALASGFRTVDSMIAIGKIGQLTSIPRLTPMILGGLHEQRDAAYRALAMILEANREWVSQLAPLPEELTRLITTQLNDPEMKLSGSTRFHMCLCLARLGERLDEARVKKYLRVELDASQANQMAGLFMRK